MPGLSRRKLGEGVGRAARQREERERRDGLRKGLGGYRIQ